MRAGNASVSARTASYSDLALFIPFFALYAFFVQFGNLTRFSDREGALGISTLILAILVLAGARRALLAFVSVPVLLLLVFLAADLAVVGVFQGGKGLSQVPLFVAYAAGAAVASSVRWTPTSLYFLWTAIGVGLLVSAGLTIVDYAGVASVPGIVFNPIATKLDGMEVEQATGFFPRRSAMAAIFSISIAGSLILAASPTGLLRRLFFLTAGGMGIVCLFLTHNRSGVLGPLIIVATYGLVSGRFRGHRRILYAASAALAASMLLFVLNWFAPEHLEVYSVKLGLSVGYEDVAGSDYLRVRLAEAVFRSLLQNPMGNGLTAIALGGADRSVHNTVIQVVWAAGLFGILWLVAFPVALYRRIASFKLRPRHPAYDACLWALGAWLLHGMTHSSLSTGLAWILLGVAISSHAASIGAETSGRVPARDPVAPGRGLDPPRALAS